MEEQHLHADMVAICQQLEQLKSEFDQALTGGQHFREVKQIHLQIKALSRTLAALTGQDSSQQAPRFTSGN